MQEEWRDIVGYEGLYQVSNFGRVKHLQFKKRYVSSLGNETYRDIKEKVLKEIDDHKGYIMVNLYKNKKFKIFRVHRLVAIAFIENKENLLYINHKDENRSNNNVENLEWCTMEYNNNYGNRTKKVAEKLLNNERSKKVVQIKNGVEIKVFESIREVERQLGFNHAKISRCCNGYNKTSKGFEWKFL